MDSRLQKELCILLHIGMHLRLLKAFVCSLPFLAESEVVRVVFK